MTWLYYSTVTGIMLRDICSSIAAIIVKSPSQLVLNSYLIFDVLQSQFTIASGGATPLDKWGSTLQCSTSVLLVKQHISASWPYGGCGLRIEEGLA